MTERLNHTARMTSRRGLLSAAPVHFVDIVVSGVTAGPKSVVTPDISKKRDPASLRGLMALSMALGLLLGACSNGAQVPGAERDSAELVAADREADEPSVSEEEQQPAESGAEEELPAVPSVDGAAGGKKTESRKGKLQPLELPFKPKLPIRAWVDTPCVERGQKVILHVEAPHESGIAYQAVYSDGRAGTDEPMGAGYGGNDKGYGPPSGEWISAWVVSPNAPPGRARVDVFVGHRAEWGYDDPHFAVADAAGRCPERWLEEGEDE